MTIRSYNDVQKEMKGMMLNKFLLVILKPLLIEPYLNLCKKPFVVAILLKIVLYSLPLFQLVTKYRGLICHCQ